MKKSILAVLAAAVGLMGLPVSAATTSGSFNVTVNLTSACVLSTITDLAFSYTSFQGTAASATGGGFTLKCTNGLSAPTFQVKQGSGTAAASVTTTDSALNLQYTVTAPTAVQAPDGTAKNYTVTGSMPANQSGTCNSSATACANTSATNKNYTLIVTY